MPFDQYQRYSVTAALVEQLGIPSGSRILEVGGGPGPLEAFLPDHLVVVSDVEGKHDGPFLLADGTRLPFPDGSFPVVVALDVLEHVPAAARRPFLIEARRVAGDAVVLSAPFAHPDVDFAEETLNEFVRSRLQVRFPTLDEHRDNGLPDLDATVAEFRDAGWAVATLPSGYLPRWLFGMIVHHELLATGVQSLSTLHAYYNRTVSPLDCAEPSYRHVVVASTRRSEQDLATAVGALRSPADGSVGDTSTAALASIASAALTQRLNAAARWERLGHDLDETRAVAEDLRRQLADRDAHVVELRSDLDRMRAELARERATIERNRYLGLARLARATRGRLSNQKEAR